MSDAFEREDVTVGRADRQAGEIGLLETQRVGQPNAHADRLRRLGEHCRDRSGQRRVNGLRHGVGGDAFHPGANGVDLHVKRIAGELHAAFDFDHAVDAADCGGDLRRLLVKRVRIEAEQLDLDRLRHGCQIADQILHELCKLDLHARHLGGDLGQDGGHDGGRRAGVIVLQPHEVVAVIRLAEIAAETGAEATGERCHLRRRADDRIDLPDLAARLGERRAGLGKVVQNETTLVDRRHEARRHRAIGHVAERQEGDEQHAEDPWSAK